MRDAEFIEDCELVALLPTSRPNPDKKEQMKGHQNTGEEEPSQVFLIRALMAFVFIAHATSANLAVILPIYVKENRPHISQS